MKRSSNRLLPVLSLVIGLLSGTLPRAEADAVTVPAAQENRSFDSAPTTIVARENASDLEMFAANELRRYIYLRTGKVLSVEQGRPAAGRIGIGCEDRAFCGALGRDLKPQQFLLKTVDAGGERTWWIVGGDDAGTLSGAYRFVEKLGVRFGLDADILPDERWTGRWPEIHELGKPRFALRGLQPFHDFSVGPDWWNAHDYQNVLSQMAKLRMNFIGLHTYPSWNPSAGPEANVWIGLPEDVDARGQVQFGYEAGVVTTRKGWEVKPYPTSRYASGAGLLFENDDYGPDFMLDCLGWPQGGEACAAMFNRYADVQQQVFSSARRLGIKTCVGTELPLGVPKALAARLEAKGMKPDDPAVIRRLYEGTFLHLMRKTPVDYYWLWTPEVWLSMEPGCQGWEMTSRANAERDLGLAQAAAQSVQARFALATCGWRLGTRENPLWMDQRTPKSWVASSIATQLGRDPVEASFGAMAGRPKWVIGWAEDDETAGAHCCTCWDLQLWVDRMFTNSLAAQHHGCEGMMAIHWRTAAVSPNLMALAQAGWDFENQGNPKPDVGVDQPLGAQAFWTDWGQAMFGSDAGVQIGQVIRKLDGSHVQINALISRGATTTDADIAGVFAPLAELESWRPRVRGAGNLERFDYWLNLVRATHLRVRTWVLADRLSAKMKGAERIQDPDAQVGYVRKEILPLRLEIARRYEDMMTAFVRCAKSPGEIGTISSIESGSRERIVTRHDSALARILKEPLPVEASVRTTYLGPTRIFVSGNRTQMSASEQAELRAFVVSGSKCTCLNLLHRFIGEREFRKVAATCRSRQAYRVKVPVSSRGTVEFYLEAVMDDGQKVLWPPTAPSLNQTLTAW